MERKATLFRLVSWASELLLWEWEKFKQPGTGPLSKSTPKVKKQKRKDLGDKKSSMTLRALLFWREEASELRGETWVLEPGILTDFIYLPAFGKRLNCSTPRVSSSFGDQATMTLHLLEQTPELVTEKSQALACSQ